jgi:hypothetical protein
MLSKLKRKQREKIYRTGVWIFLVVFVFSVAAASIIMLSAPANPPGH